MYDMQYDRHEEWTILVNTLYEKALKALENSPEGRVRQELRRQADDFLTWNLSGSQQEILSDLLCQLEADAARTAEVLYRRGIQDGIWLLKNLGVLA